MLTVLQNPQIAPSLLFEVHFHEDQDRRGPRFLEGSSTWLTLYHPPESCYVLVAVKDDALCGIPVSPCSSCFLIESLHGLWYREMKDETDVGFVYAHPKGNRGTHHLLENTWRDRYWDFRKFVVSTTAEKANKQGNTHTHTQNHQLKAENIRYWDFQVYFLLFHLKCWVAFVACVKWKDSHAIQKKQFGFLSWLWLGQFSNSGVGRKSCILVLLKVFLLMDLWSWRATSTTYCSSSCTPKEHYM